MSLIYEKVTIEMLRPGVPFYRANPIENNHNVLPSYNINLDDDPETAVWVVYPDWQKNPFIKPEYFYIHKGLNPAMSGLINSFNSDFTMNRERG